LVTLTLGTSQLLGASAGKSIWERAITLLVGMHQRDGVGTQSPSSISEMWTAVGHLLPQLLAGTH